MSSFISNAKVKALLRGLSIGLFCTSAALFADDTEVFFGKNSNTEDSNPNILFILDTSGSMNNRDNGSTTRMERLKEAMYALIDQSSSFNVGVMGFSGHNRGGSVRYPIGYLEGVTTPQCPDTGCPDEVIVSRPRHSTDDAFEKVHSGEVIVDSPSLFLGEYIDDTPPVPPTEPTISGVASLAETVQEAFDYSASAGPDQRVISHNDYEHKHAWIGLTPVDDYSPTESGYRFTNVEIPSNAIITDAYIEFTNSAAATGDISLNIWGDASANPDNYVSAIEPLNPYLSARVKTSELVPWPNIAAQNAGTTQATPSLKDVVQEIISLPGWASGGDMSFIFESQTAVTSSSDLRNFYAWSTLEDQRPKLHFSYQLPPGTTTLVSEATHYTYEAVNTADNTVTARYNATTTETLFSFDTGHDPGFLAFRFPDINIPDGAVIEEAYLEVKTSGLVGDFAANLSAELVGNTIDYQVGADQRDRVSTTTFESLNMVDGTLSTPNLAGIIDEILATPDWTSGNPISIHIRPGTGYDHGTDAISIATSNATTEDKPKLTITYSETATTVDPVDQSVVTGLRFTNLHVPPAATIQSAVIEFQSAAANAEDSTFEIRAEATDNATAFSPGVNNDLTNRQLNLTTAGKLWTAEPWDTVGNQFQSVDIANIVQELVNRPGWCGGNAIALLLDGTGLREAISFDQSSVNAPTLRVTYAPDSVDEGAYCSNRSAVIPISSNSDDGVESDSSNAVDLNASTLELHTDTDGSSSMGLRFRGITVPQGATVVSAVIELSAAADLPGGIGVDIQVDNTDDSLPLETTAANLSSRYWSTASINWDSIPTASLGENVFSPDVTSLVSSIVNRDGWNSGNAMSFRLKSTGGSGDFSFYSYEGDDALSARLIIYYQGVRSSPSALFKENLRNAISELVAQDGTPIVDVLYEGALYMKGMPVDYGKQRGSQKYIDRNSRVSHPYSYTGGTISRAADCTDADLSAESCIYETITGTPVYISPMTNQCQQNHIVLLSDGEATSNSSQSKVKAMTGDTTCAYRSNSTENCGTELATYLANTDHAPLLPGSQKVVTHTIGFNISNPQFLQDIAQSGGGQFYPASSATDLLNAFKNIFVSVSKTDTSFVAPSASINQFNRLKNRDDIYFSIFKPESTMRWSGNIKRYRIKGNSDSAANIVDVNGVDAVDPNTGQFKASSRSYWSNVVDGPSVSKGGAAGEFEFMNARKVLTYNGNVKNLMDVDNRVASGNNSIDLTNFSLPLELASDTAYVDSLIDWAAGYDAQDEDADGNVKENRVHMGDPLHSQPLVLNYSSSTTAPDSVVFAATNEGYLHAFNYADGTEHFAFIPTDLFKNLRYYYENDVTTGERRYGLDGHLSAWIKDTNHNGVIDAAAGDKAYLYIGMRRGGRKIFALDISDYNQPKYLWHIDASSAGADAAIGDYSNLGETWSKVLVKRIMTSGGPRDVLIFGGGYDRSNHDSVNGSEPGVETGSNLPSVDILGRTWFIADAETGELLWQADPLAYSDMNYSIPGDLRAIDVNSDGLTDQIYFGDLGGQVWRFDINNDDSTSKSLDNRITGGVVANFGGTGADNRRRFFYTPDVAVVSVGGTQHMAVSIGSGWRSHPLNTTVQDRFYSFRLPDVYAPPTDKTGKIRYTTITNTTAGMIDVTNSTGSDPTNAIGWYFDLPETGEKVLSSSVTLDGQVVFTSYIPAATIDECAAAVGSGRVYVVDVLNGDPVIALGESGSSADPDSLNVSHRSKVLNHAGIPPAPTVIFPEGGKATVLVGTETPDPNFDVGEPKRRTFWREHVDENS